MTDANKNLVSMDISALPEVSSGLADTDLFMIQRANGSYAKITRANLKNYL
jgi:hypothetical protein